MRRRPLRNQRPGPPWQPPLQQVAGLDRHRHFELTLNRVEVQGRVVAITHVDRDPVEGGNSRQSRLLSSGGLLDRDINCTRSARSPKGAEQRPEPSVFRSALDRGFDHYDCRSIGDIIYKLL